MSSKIQLKDIDEAAYLWLSGMKYIGATKKNNGRKEVVYFEFEGEDFEEHRNKYRNGDATVEPHEYSSKQLELRKIVREILDS